MKDMSDMKVLELMSYSMIYVSHIFVRKIHQLQNLLEQVCVLSHQRVLFLFLSFLDFGIFKYPKSYFSHNKKALLL